MSSRFVVGIDLGTTNSAVGYVDLKDSSPGGLEIISFNIPQLVESGRVADRSTLPSFLYLPGEFDLGKGALSLPWDDKRTYAVGSFARDQGALVPGRLVSSAKSWLCHDGVDRQAPILPWGAGSDVEKVSPVSASARYLQHIREAWDYKMPEPLSEQVVILTVPASFDEVARELTLQAAREAGLPSVVLLEEPLAAFYAWLSHNENSWKELLNPGDTILICDVGGGTTDFTLVGCEAGDDGPSLERLAVGDHLLLGGDNVDLAIADLAEKQLSQKLDAARYHTLLHQCRQAKEKLLEENGPEETVIRLAGRGRSLIGGMLITKLSRKVVQELVLDRFFPKSDLNEAVKISLDQTEGSSLGLPYVKEVGVTRHLARFLMQQGKGNMPTAVLFNGGTLTPGVVQKRLLDTISQWAGRKIRALEHKSLDLAISWGAAYYGLVRKGLGLRVGGGIARSYFIGVDVKGETGREGKAICLVERGTEEGAQVEIEKVFHVRTNVPVKFSIFSSTTRTGDHVGDIVTIEGDDFVKLPPLKTVLRYGKKGKSVNLPVRIGASVTPIGTLEMYCESQESPHKWRLQFELRKEEKKEAENNFIEGVRVGQQPGKSPEEAEERISEEDKRALERAKEAVESCFSKGDLPPSGLPARLSEAFGMEKDLWSLPVLRSMADFLLEFKAAKGKSPQHEARWLNLTGFCMRPGNGEEMDPWRIKKAWPLFFEGVVFSKDKEVRLQWWIFWRRIAAGLSSGQQTQLFAPVAKVLLPGQTRRRKKGKKEVIKVSKEERREMWLFAANLERLEVKTKIELGRGLVDSIEKGQAWKGSLWALSRIGARQLLYGPADRVVPPGEVTRWLESLKKRDWKDVKELVPALLSMARLTGDRTRDLDVVIRQQIAVWLQSKGVEKDKLVPLQKVVPLASREQSRVFGESLPEGLMFISGEE